MKSFNFPLQKKKIRLRKNIKTQPFQSTGKHPKGKQELETYLFMRNDDYGVKKQNKTMNLWVSCLGDFSVPKFQK